MADDKVTCDDLTVNVNSDFSLSDYSSILTSTMNNTLNYSSGINSGQYTITTGGTSAPSYSPYTFTSPNTIVNTSIGDQSGVLEVQGKNADLKINGKSLKTFMEKVEERLLILQPDPAKLEKYAALKKAYEHYKLMEKLVQED